MAAERRSAFLQGKNQAVKLPFWNVFGLSVDLPRVISCTRFLSPEDLPAQHAQVRKVRGSSALITDGLTCHPLALLFKYLPKCHRARTSVWGVGGACGVCVRFL